MLVHSAPEQCWQLSRGGYGVSQSSEEVSSLLVKTSGHWYCYCGRMPWNCWAGPAPAVCIGAL